MCELYESEMGCYSSGRLHSGQSAGSYSHHHYWPGEAGTRWDVIETLFVSHITGWLVLGGIRFRVRITQTVIDKRFLMNLKEC